jgi:hypothetical protein
MTQARLRIEPAKCSPANDYRIRDGEVEFRVIEPASHYASNWRRLDENDVQLHRALQTVVAKWIEERLDSGQSYSDIT